MAVVTAKVVADTPWFGQGDIDANPRPEPSANNTNETDAATKAPAMMAGHDAADWDTEDEATARAYSARGSGDCSIFLFP
jgi:hypothetical protein